jgi:hypothetical protein
MTVKELMETLESCNPDAEVRIATQSSYPFQSSVAGAVDGNLIVEYAMDERPGERVADIIGDFNGSVDPDTVYIVEGSQLGYFTKRAWEAI